MKRKLRVMGVAIAAVFAFNAFAAAAQAGDFEVEAGVGGTITIKAEQLTRHVFGYTPGVFECTTGRFTGGSLTNKSATLLMTPEYKGCITAGVMNAFWTVNKCKFDFHAGETDGGNPDKVNITVDIVECPESAPITITSATGCVVKISNQTGLTGITAENRTAEIPMDLFATINVSGIAYTEVGGTAKCGTGTTEGQHSGANGMTWRGTMTIRDNAGVKGVTVT